MNKSEVNRGINLPSYAQDPQKSSKRCVDFSTEVETRRTSSYIKQTCGGSVNSAAPSAVYDGGGEDLRTLTLTLS